MTCIGPMSLLLLLSISVCADSEPSDHQNRIIPEGPFMGIEATDTPVLLFPDFINTAFGEYNGTFNSDGSQFFYTVSNIDFDVVVFTTLQKDGTWSTPAFAPFSAPYHEFDPLFAPEGNQIFYSSHRPTKRGGSSNASNIWKVEKLESGWSEPVLVPLFGPSQGNYFSSLTDEGDIYFNIWNTGDMYKATKQDTGYRIESLGDIVNSRQGDGDPFIAPDGSYLIFRSYRPGGMGNGDLWISFRIENEWQQPMNLGEPINSEYNEMCPYVTTDGRLFIFSSGRFHEHYYDAGLKDLTDVNNKLSTWDNGQQNIYAMSAGFIEDLRATAIETTR